jgi:hypothetical protein
MKNPKFLIVLTIVNVLLVAFQLMRTQVVEAKGDAGILRGRELHIVDEAGRTRAWLGVLPEVPGSGYHETVILRLIDRNGRPNVKLTEADNAAGLALGGETDATYAILKAEGDDGMLKLTSKNGREQVIKP